MFGWVYYRARCGERDALASDGKPSFPTWLRKRWSGVEEGIQGRPGFPSCEGHLTVFLSLGGHEPLVHVLQGTIKGELEAGVGEDGDQGGVQAFVEDQGAFGPVHGHHGVSKGFIHLDSTCAARMSVRRWFRPRTRPSRASPLV